MHEKVIQILSEVKNNDDLLSSLSASSDIVNDVGLDSLQMINFILKLEDEFCIEIDFEAFDYSHLDSIDKLCCFIDKCA